MKLSHAIMVPALLALAACGTTKEDRTVSGAMIGATTGAVIGSAVGSATTGAMVGGAVGAATGAMADPDAINLGKPWWK
jgi:osmotically inducible lipoprotein OsmB